MQWFYWWKLHWFSLYLVGDSNILYEHFDMVYSILIYPSKRDTCILWSISYWLEDRAEWLIEYYSHHHSSFEQSKPRLLLKTSHPHTKQYTSLNFISDLIFSILSFSIKFNQSQYSKQISRPFYQRVFIKQSINVRTCHRCNIDNNTTILFPVLVHVFCAQYGAPVYCFLMLNIKTVLQFL